MGMDEIWQQLTPESRDWLVANNGDVVPADIAAEIDELIEATDTDDVWGSAVATSAYPGAAIDPDDDVEDPATEQPGARYLADDAVDWIEGRANDE